MERRGIWVHTMLLMVCTLICIWVHISHNHPLSSTKNSEVKGDFFFFIELNSEDKLSSFLFVEKILN
jgi:hypothetical protein